MTRAITFLRAVTIAIGARAAQAERAGIIAYLHQRADALENGDGSRMSEDKLLHARRLRALADQIEQGLHDRHECGQVA